MHIGMYVKIIIIIIMHSDGCTHSILALFFFNQFSFIFFFTDVFDQMHLAFFSFFFLHALKITFLKNPNEIAGDVFPIKQEV